MKGRSSPAVSEHQRPDPPIGDVANLVELREYGVEMLARLRHPSFVIWPSAILPAHVAGKLPVERCGVIAKYVTDAAPIEQRRCGLDDVEVMRPLAEDQVHALGTHGLRA